LRYACGASPIKVTLLQASCEVEGTNVTLRVQEEDLGVYLRNELPNGVQLSDSDEDEAPAARCTMLSRVPMRCNLRYTSIG